MNYEKERRETDRDRETHRDRLIERKEKKEV